MDVYREQLAGLIERQSHPGHLIGPAMIGFAVAKKERSSENSLTLELFTPLSNAIAVIIFLVLCSRPAKTAMISVATRAQHSSQSSVYEQTKT